MHILRFALETDGATTAAEESHFLAFVQELLATPSSDNSLTLATIHASKGAEHDHVIVFHPGCRSASLCHQYNLIGRGPVNSGQEKNLLYIAVTRARKSGLWFFRNQRPTATLTFLMHRRTQHVPSILLPSEIIHCLRTQT